MGPEEPVHFHEGGNGRAAMLERLREAWARARAGQGGLVHLVSPPGGGRSALIAGFLDSVTTPGDQAAVVSCRCTDDTFVTTERGTLEELVVRVAEGVRAIEVSGDEPPAGEGSRRHLQSADAAKAPVEGAGGRVPWLLPASDFLSAATGIAALPTTAPQETGAPPRHRIFADLLLDVSREHPVLLVVDDAHRADPASRRVLELVAKALRAGGPFRLLLVLASPEPLADRDGPLTDWRPVPEAVWHLPPPDDDVLRARVRARVARFGEPAPKFVDRVLKLARGNPRLVDALIGVAERAGAFRQANRRSLDDAKLEDRPEAAGLRALAEGHVPEMPAHVRADLQAAAVLGRRFEAGLLGRLWEVPLEAARARIQALVATGLVEPEGSTAEGLYAFLSADLPFHFADELSEQARESLHARVAMLLRASGRRGTGVEEPRRPFLDVTETWSETKRRDRRIREEQESLWAASKHFARARRHTAAAEAAVTLVERLFETSGGYSYLAGRYGRREDRERRHRIYVALTEAANQLRLAKAAHSDDGLDPERLAIDIRLQTVRARFKEVMGDFAEARAMADGAVQMAGHVDDAGLRLEAMRSRVEVCYAAGDHNAGRQSTVELLAELARAPRDEAVRVYGWLAEAIGRWEWAGLHDRLFPYVIGQLRTLRDDRAAIKAMMERLSASNDSDASSATPPALVEEVINEARATGQLPYAAEQMATYAADIIQGMVDAHYDSLSGEFYPPDLYGEGPTAHATPLPERLQWPVDLLDRAEGLARESENRIARLRALTTTLGIVYDVRERMGELLERWHPLAEEETPVRLRELEELLESGFFGVEHVERLTERTCTLAQSLGLDQVVADTIYEALDRELPGALRRRKTLFDTAAQAYERVGDAYGLITLLLVDHRLHLRAGHDGAQVLGQAVKLFEERGDELNVEQRAYVRMRFGELLLVDGKGSAEEAVDHLEHAIRLYDQLGDMERVQSVGETLRDVYRQQGDLGRYRMLRERFRALEASSVPGVDPLGLELRIEHLLTLARHEADEERAIEMVERCVQLFGRMPDSTTRIDECFVEISKICRRRADEAQTEPAFRDWLRRSLEAVRAAARINRSLGNFHRVFEEYHEMFDDLLGLGEYDEYLRARAESRELSFAVGNVGELMYLFEEHLQYDPDAGFDYPRLPAVRGFYEALQRYLLGLGADAQAQLVQSQFVDFLEAIGEPDLASDYREREPYGDQE
jgi:hypothetical protein